MGFRFYGVVVIYERDVLHTGLRTTMGEGWEYRRKGLGLFYRMIVICLKGISFRYG